MQKLIPLTLLCLLIITRANPAAADPTDHRPLVTIMIGEPEYRTETTLPKFAKQFLQDDYRVQYVLEDPIQEHVFTNIEQVERADVLLISVRRKTLPTEQLDVIRRYLAAGKPVIGIRTANHAFSLRGGDPPAGCSQWLNLDADVFGGNYTGHYANELPSTVTVVPAATEHPIVRGMTTLRLSQIGSLYKTEPLAAKTQLLLIGSGEGTGEEPVAWTFERADGGRSFYTSLGHWTDFDDPAFGKLLRQAIDWSLTR